MKLDVPLAHGEDPAAESAESTTGYASLVYCCPTHLCAPLAFIALILFLFLVFIPMVYIAIAAFVFFYCYNRKALWHRLHSLTRVGKAREEVLNNKYLPIDDIIRDWTGASGTFNSEESEKAVHLTFSRSVQKTEKRIWKISGKAADGTFVIQKGLIAESGKAYWVEHHNDDQKRIILTQGYFDYNTDRFVLGTWKDSQGCDGTYPNLKREEKYVVRSQKKYNPAAPDAEDSKAKAAKKTVQLPVSALRH
jgi:hypothetical protein